MGGGCRCRDGSGQSIARRARQLRLSNPGNQLYRIRVERVAANRPWRYQPIRQPVKSTGNREPRFSAALATAEICHLDPFAHLTIDGRVRLHEMRALIWCRPGRIPSRPSEAQQSEADYREHFHCRYVPPVNGTRHSDFYRHMVDNSSHWLSTFQSPTSRARQQRRPVHVLPVACLRRCDQTHLPAPMARALAPERRELDVRQS